MISPKFLLAKSTETPDMPRPNEMLSGHIRNVITVASALLDSIGSQALDSMSLGDAYSEKLRVTLLRSAFLHDLGKANHHFQRMVRRESELPQAFRHELISVWLTLKFHELERWLLRDCDVDTRFTVLCAALGHHLKLDDGAQIETKVGTGDSELVVFTNHTDFLATMALGQEILGLGPPPTSDTIVIDLIRHPLTELRDWLFEAQGWFENTTNETRRFVALVKAMMISSDVAGSAISKERLEPGEWTKNVLSQVCTEQDLKGIAQIRLGNNTSRPFQEKVACSKNRVTFVKAGCGNGKTVAAYLWAARNAHCRKLFVCYPTTGTSTEGFRDYIVPSESRNHSALLHSRSEIDLESILITPRETDENVVDWITEQNVRLESLSSWDVRIVICTVDSVLGLIQNQRRGLFSFPSYANAAFVFDEIHQYDNRLFGCLLDFLETFRGTPILLMTASLPPARMMALNERVQIAGNQLEIIEGPADLEQIPRYIIRQPIEAPPWDEILEAISANQKVLWVANTVDRAVAFAREAQQRGLPAIPYHSRYRYCDRVDKHNAVIEAFREEHREPVIAITTQVCEVSLDLSADLLITDLAPVSALIQRMGRLNRRVTVKNPGSVRPVIILNNATSLPYEKQEFETTRKWLGILGNGHLSQADLTRAFDEVSEDEPIRPQDSQWLLGGWRSTQAPIREAGVTIPIIREEDAVACRNQYGKPIPKEITRFAIPMPLGKVKSEIISWSRLNFVFIAPRNRIEYSKEWGAKWLKK